MCNQFGILQSQFLNNDLPQDKRLIYQILFGILFAIHLEMSESGLNTHG